MLYYLYMPSAPDLQQLLQRAQAILQANNRGQWTVPSPILYPHQWLWDSCFIAMGLKHYDVQRAAIEIKSLFRGQWKNGMLPNIIFTPGTEYWADPSYWQSRISEFAPEEFETSTITQPPLPAIVAWAVSQQMPEAAATVFLKELYPKLLAYHSWLYRERDPDNQGLVVLVHPWESGLDNTPPWIKALSFTPAWVSFLIKSGGMKFLRRLRKDIKHIPAEQKITDIEALKLLHRLHRFRKRGYNNLEHLRRSRDTVQDLGFNCILIKANQELRKIASFISEDLPPDLDYKFQKASQALESLWDDRQGKYFSRHYKRQRLIKVSSVAEFFPLYSGAITPARATQLVVRLKQPNFWPAFPVPSTPLDSKYFDELRYWSGPSWINTNWLIIRGLENYGFTAEANWLRQTCFKLIQQSGFHEYFSALSGKGLGVDNFSWTAALFIDLVKSSQAKQEF